MIHPQKSPETIGLTDSRFKHAFLPGLLLVLAVIGVLARYACELNTEYYRVNAPFFDSAAYTNKLAEVWDTTRAHGVLSGVRDALTGSTAPLPDLQAIALMETHLMGPRVTRYVPILLESAWLALLATALFLYLWRYRGFNQWVSAALTTPFLMFSQIFSFNGGLSDFRLDLALYIFISLTLVIYLITEETDSLWPWVVMGFSVSVTCLERATAPVYLTVMLGPVLLVRLFRAKDQSALVRKFVIMLIPPVVIVGSSFFYNASYLYYYYFIWNADANAKLPVSTSSKHVLFGLQHVGPALLAALALFVIAICIETAVAGPGPRRIRVRDLNWRFLYWGLAPLGFLVFRGAGLNPFVSMPAVFGIVLFAILPLRKRPASLNTVFTQAALVLVLAACGWNAAAAVGRHAPNPEIRISALKTGIELMRHDAQARGAHEISFETAHVWNFEVSYLKNVLLFDFGATADGPAVSTPDGTVWRMPEANFFGAAVPVVWREIPGSDDATKVEWLSQAAQRELDYIFLPTPRTIDVLEQHIAHNYINLKVRAIRARFLESGEWRPVGPPISITNEETVQLYANVKRTRGAVRDAVQ